VTTPAVGVKSATLLSDLVSLTKPRIISLLLVTAIAPMYIAGRPGIGLALVMFVGGYMIAGGANAVNMYLDSDIDTVMARTKLRPIPSGRMGAKSVLAFGVALATAATFLLAWTTNVLAAGLALPLGVLMGAFAPIHHIFEPIMAPLRYMPISAFIPLLILWFGIYESEKIAFLFLGVFVYLLPVVVSAIRAVPDELVQTALTLGATKGQVIRTVLLPAALPEIFDSFRVMNAISWTYVILAEAVNPEHGLGYMVELARTHQKASWSFAGLIVIGGIGLLTDFIIRTISQILFRWREEAL